MYRNTILKNYKLKSNTDIRLLQTQHLTESVETADKIAACLHPQKVGPSLYLAADM